MVKEDLMWKRYKYMILSFFFVVGIFVVGVKLPDFVSATGTDKTDKVRGSLSMSFYNGSTRLYNENSQIIDMSEAIRAEIEFYVKFNGSSDPTEHIGADDYVEFFVGNKLRFAGDDRSKSSLSLPAYDNVTGKKICDVTYTVDNSTGEIKARFDFKNADPDLLIKKGGYVKSILNFEVDPSKIDFVNITNETVRLYDKNYKVSGVKKDINLEYEGVLDPKEGVINWTATIDAKNLSIGPNAAFDLTGYKTVLKVNGDWNTTYTHGSFVPGSFTVNGVSKADADIAVVAAQAYEQYTYSIIAADQAGDKIGKLVITFKTKVDFNISLSTGRSYDGNAAIYEPDFRDGKDKQSNVNVKRFGYKTNANVSNPKSLAWVMEINEANYSDLGSVIIKDVLGKDTLDRMSQNFEKAYYVSSDTYIGDAWNPPAGAVSVNPSISGNEYTFTIPNVDKHLKLVIVTSVNQMLDNDFLTFENEAYYYWGTSADYKFKSKAVKSVGKFGLSKSIRLEAENTNPETEVLKDVGAGGFEVDWVLQVKKDTMDSTGSYYLYDTFIHDTSVNADRKNLTITNGFSIREYGNHSNTTLRSGIDFQKIMPDNKDNRHQRLADPANPIHDNTVGTDGKVYEIVYSGRVVGYLVEIKLKNGEDNIAKIKGRISDPRTIFSENSSFDSAKVYNYMILTRANERVQEKSAQYTYYPKMLKKDTLTSAAAIRFLNNPNADDVNYDLSSKRGNIVYRDNMVKDATGYNSDTKSIIYRLSVNASGVKDEFGEFGKFVVKDSLKGGFKLTPIIKGGSPADDKYFLIYKGSSDSNLDSSVGIVKAEGNYLSDAQLSANNITSTPTDVGGNRMGYEFKFDKIDGPYVILFKAEMTDKTPTSEFFNEHSVYQNEATIELEGKMETLKLKPFTGSIGTAIDNRIFKKTAQKSQVSREEPVTWIIDYMPLKKYASGDNTKVRLVDTLDPGETLQNRNKAVLRKEKGTNNLIFEGDNYKIVKGTFIRDKYESGMTFSVEEEITDGLEQIFTYDSTKGELSINIPDKNSGYRISYKTDFTKNMPRGNWFNNSIDLYEDSTKVNGNRSGGSSVRVSEDAQARAYGTIYDLPYERLFITKTNAEGAKLSGAKFKIKKITTGTTSVEEKISEPTDAEGHTKFEELTSGEYLLTEETPPAGYAKGETPYKIKVVELEYGFKTSLAEDYGDKIKLVDNNITIINEPAKEEPNKPGGSGETPGGGENPNPGPPQTPNTEEPKPAPKGDEEPKKPDKSENPKKDKPSDKGSKDKPSDPDEPGPNKDKPSVPTYPLDNTPDPNLPNSPKEIDVIYRDGTPIGRFIKRDREDGKKEYVLKRDGTPLTRFKKIKKAELPKTGGVDNIYYYLFGAGFALVSGMISGIMARRRYAVRKRNRYK